MKINRKCDRMNDLQKKYALVLLKTCLKVDEKQPLFISFNLERLDFVRIVVNTAYDLGVTDIYLDMVDSQLKHDALKNLSVEDCKELSYFNKAKWNEYAKKNAAFLMLASETPGLMNDINPLKIQELTKYSNETRKVFDDMRDKSSLAWCIACVPTQSWAELLFEDDDDPVTTLWMKIFEICDITKDDPISTWNEKIKILSRRANRLNDYNFKKLVYKNGKGTDFSVSLPENHLWASGKETLINGKEILVNYPTEEVFTSPNYKSAEGIVYSAKPLNYQDNIIDEFYIKFKEGKVVDAKAKVGDEYLQAMINTCDNSNYLGEVALVENSSSISSSGITFFETLFDENASCHLALGASFPECIKDGPKKEKEELLNLGLNQCDSHVDFMIGTSDLEITGITQDNEKTKIFENGNFTKEFK